MLEIDATLYHDLDEIAIQQELVGIVEVMVYTEEIYDPADLLIFHYRLYKGCRLRGDLGAEDTMQ